MHRPLEPGDRVVCDLPSVLNAFVDGVSEVESHEDMGHAVLVGVKGAIIHASLSSPPGSACEAVGGAAA